MRWLDRFTNLADFVELALQCQLIERAQRQRVKTQMGRFSIRYDP
jgi:hypothetical protein